MRNLKKFNDIRTTHFVTLVTYERFPYFRNEESCQLLLEELVFYKKKYNFKLLGYVIMPDHFHCLIYLQEKDISISKIIQSIKIMVSKRVKRTIFYSNSSEWVETIKKEEQDRCDDIIAPIQDKSDIANISFRLWQKGFYDFQIFNKEKLIEKLNYIHLNPVVHHLVENPLDFKWSSYREFNSEITNGLLDKDFI